LPPISDGRSPIDISYAETDDMRCDTQRSKTDTVRKEAERDAVERPGAYMRGRHGMDDVGA